LRRFHLVLLPGLDGTGVLFGPLVRALPPTLTPHVVAYPPDLCLGYPELLPLVLAALASDGDFVLLGESFSGPLALLAAVRRPPNVRGVVLCASFVRKPVRLVPRCARGLVSPLLCRLFPAFALFKALVGGYSSRELRGLMAKAHAMVSPAALACRLRAVLEVDVSEELRACPVPLLYLAGARDHVVPRHNLRGIARLRPDVQSVVLPTPHLVLQTRPVEAAKALADFAAGLP
jgi:pimeloyl-ACP methyl ester carboxylesterase